MFSIPETYYKNNEDYITLPAIQHFMRSHPEGKFKLSLPREALLDSIIDFGNQNDTNAELVLTWVDEVLQEGIKDIYLQCAPLSEEMVLLFSSKEGVEGYIKNFKDNSTSKHICINQYDIEYRLVSAEYFETDHGRKITFIYCRKLHVHDKANRSTKAIDYPVIADFFIDSQWLLVRAKPRSNIYVYNPNGFNIEEATSTTTEKEIRSVTILVEKILGTERVDKSYITSVLKNKIFELLHKYSNTPSEIARIMQEKSEYIADISAKIQSMCAIPDVCSIPHSMSADIDEDINNIVEKYMSITWKDKDIFVKDREAYPIKLSATDEEESKVEQTAALEEPLQTKALFFDNKKMLYKSKKCDGVVFQWKRKSPMSFTKDSFAVRIFAKPNGNCIFKFSEYTAKEDIENVVFSVIDNKTPSE